MATWKKILTEADVTIGSGSIITAAERAKLNGIEASADVNLTTAQIKAAIGTGNGKLVPSAGNAGEFLKHDGSFGTPSYIANTDTQLTNAEVRAAVEAASNSNVFTDADHTKLNGVEADATADQTAAEIQALVGTGNSKFVPSAGTAGHFLKHDGTFGLPSYIANTDVNVSKANLTTVLASYNGDDTLNIGDAGDDTTVVIRGNLQVDGTTTTVNSTQLTVDDKIITAASGGTDATTVGIAGLEIDTEDTTQLPFMGFVHGAGLTEMVVKAEGNTTAFPIAIMEFSANSTPPSGNAGGVGRFHFDTGDNKLYIRTV
jgi:hypothetical protein